MDIARSTSEKVVRTASDILLRTASLPSEPREVLNHAGDVVCEASSRIGTGGLARTRLQKAGQRVLHAVHFVRTASTKVDRFGVSNDTLDGEEEPVVGQWMDNRGSVIAITESNIEYPGASPVPLTWLGRDSISCVSKGRTYNGKLVGDRLVWDSKHVWIRLDADILEQEDAEERCRCHWSDRLKFAVVQLYDAGVQAFMRGLSTYPFHYMIGRNAFAFLHSKRIGSPVVHWYGPVGFLYNVGYLGIFHGLTPYLASKVVNSVLQRLPDIIWYINTGHFPSKAKARSRKIVSGCLKVIPVMCLDIAWIRMLACDATCHPEYQAPSKAVGAVLSCAKINLPKGLFDVPWWLIIVKAAVRDIPAFEVWRRYLPADHVFAERRGLAQSVNDTPLFIPRMGLMPILKLPLPDFSWTFVRFQLKSVMTCGPLSGLIGQLIVLPLRFMHSRFRRKVLRTFYEDEEDYLQRKLRHAHDRVNGVRGHVNLKSLRHDEVQVSSDAGIKEKRSATKSISKKRAVLLEEVKKHATKLSAKAALPAQSQTAEVVVDRSNLLQSLQKIARVPSLALKLGHLKVRFSKEKGVDAGGVFRDYMYRVAGAVNQSSLFEPGPDAGLLPRRQSDAHGIWREQVFAFGRLIALAIISNTPLDVRLSHCIYKLLLGEQITALDVARVDPEFYKHRIAAILRKGGVCATEAALGDELKFESVGIHGAEQEELISNGCNIRVTEKNKGRYVLALVEHYLLGRCRSELSALVEGFQDVIPPMALQRARARGNLDAIDLELLVTGLPSIDVDDWMKHAQVDIGSQSDARVITWFWDIIRAMDDDDRARVLSFTCGSGQVPSSGMKAYRPPFTIRLIELSEDRLPTAHTCANQIELPSYASKEKLEEQLRRAIKFDVGFGFA